MVMENNQEDKAKDDVLSEFEELEEEEDEEEEDDEEYNGYEQQISGYSPRMDAPFRHEAEDFFTVVQNPFGVDKSIEFKNKEEIIEFELIRDENGEILGQDDSFGLSPSINDLRSSSINIQTPKNIKQQEVEEEIDGYITSNEFNNESSMDNNLLTIPSISIHNQEEEQNNLNQQEQKEINQSTKKQSDRKTNQLNPTSFNFTFNHDTKNDNETKDEISDEKITGGWKSEECGGIGFLGKKKKRKKQKMVPSIIDMLPVQNAPQRGAVTYAWNEEFQAALDMKDGPKKWEKLARIARDFVYCSKTYGKIIISEYLLPDNEKTIRPLTGKYNGIAGGKKYICSGIFFKFALDQMKSYRKGSKSEYMYGVKKANDQAAMKAARNDMIGLLSYYNCGVMGLHYPLMSQIDYRGFRLIALSIIPIEGDITLEYGSRDAGNHLQWKPEIAKKMKQVGKLLNLKGHKVNSHDHVIYGPADIEAHRGKDGKFYVIDFARVFPPEAPCKKTREIYYNLLRPEFVRMNPVPLSSDAYSGFSADNDPPTEVYNATIYLFKNIVPQFVHQQLSKLTIENFKSFRLTEQLHRSGLNCRHLGRVRAQVYSAESTFVTKSVTQFDFLLIYLLSEMLARLLTSILRNLLREEMRGAKIAAREDPYVEVVYQFLLIVLKPPFPDPPSGPELFPKPIDMRELSTDENNNSIEFPNSLECLENVEFWCWNMKCLIQQKFKRALSPQELSERSDIRNLVFMPFVLQRLCTQSGIRLSKHAIVEYEESAGMKDFQLMKFDIEKVTARVRHLNVIDEALANILFEETKKRTMEVRYRPNLWNAINEKFQKAVASNTTNVQTFVRWGDMLITQCSKLPFHFKDKQYTEQSLILLQNAYEKFSDAESLSQDCWEIHFNKAQIQTIRAVILISYATSDTVALRQWYFSNATSEFQKAFHIEPQAFQLMVTKVNDLYNDAQKINIFNEQHSGVIYSLFKEKSFLLLKAFYLLSTCIQVAPVLPDCTIFFKAGFILFEYLRHIDIKSSVMSNNNYQSHHESLVSAKSDFKSIYSNQIFKDYQRNLQQQRNNNPFSDDDDDNDFYSSSSTNHRNNNNNHHHHTNNRNHNDHYQSHYDDHTNNYVNTNNININNNNNNNIYHDPFHNESNFNSKNNMFNGNSQSLRKNYRNNFFTKQSLSFGSRLPGTQLPLTNNSTGKQIHSNSQTANGNLFTGISINNNSYRTYLIAEAASMFESAFLLTASASDSDYTYIFPDCKYRPLQIHENKNNSHFNRLKKHKNSLTTSVHFIKKGDNSNGAAAIYDNNSTSEILVKYSPTQIYFIPFVMRNPELHFKKTQAINKLYNLLARGDIHRDKSWDIPQTSFVLHHPSYHSVVITQFSVRCSNIKATNHVHIHLIGSTYPHNNLTKESIHYILTSRRFPEAPLSARNTKNPNFVDKQQKQEQEQQKQEQEEEKKKKLSESVELSSSMDSNLPTFDIDKDGNLIETHNVDNDDENPTPTPTPNPNDNNNEDNEKNNDHDNINNLYNNLRNSNSNNNNIDNDTNNNFGPPNHNEKLQDAFLLGSFHISNNEIQNFTIDNLNSCRYITVIIESNLSKGNHHFHGFQFYGFQVLRKDEENFTDSASIKKYYKYHFSKKSELPKVSWIKDRDCPAKVSVLSPSKFQLKGTNTSNNTPILRNIRSISSSGGSSSFSHHHHHHLSSSSGGSHHHHSLNKNGIHFSVRASPSFSLSYTYKKKTKKKDKSTLHKSSSKRTKISPVLYYFTNCKSSDQQSLITSAIEAYRETAHKTNKELTVFYMSNIEDMISNLNGESEQVLKKRIQKGLLRFVFALVSRPSFKTSRGEVGDGKEQSDEDIDDSLSSLHLNAYAEDLVKSIKKHPVWNSSLILFYSANTSTIINFDELRDEENYIWTCSSSRQVIDFMAMKWSSLDLNFDPFGAFQRFRELQESQSIRDVFFQSVSNYLPLAKRMKSHSLLESNPSSSNIYKDNSSTTTTTTSSAAQISSSKSTTSIAEVSSNDVGGNSSSGGGSGGGNNNGAGGSGGGGGIDLHLSLGLPFPSQITNSNQNNNNNNNQNHSNHSNNVKYSNESSSSSTIANYQSTTNQESEIILPQNDPNDVDENLIAPFMYFEIKIPEQWDESFEFAIGVTPGQFKTNSLPGYCLGSYAWHGVAGVLYCGQDETSFLFEDEKKHFFAPGDIVGCGYDLFSKELYWTKNGLYIGTAIHGSSSVHPRNASFLFATVGLESSSLSFEIKANFGEEAFLFNWLDMPMDSLSGSNCTVSADASEEEISLRNSQNILKMNPYSESLFSYCENNERNDFMLLSELSKFSLSLQCLLRAHLSNRTKIQQNYYHHLQQQQNSQQNAHHHLHFNHFKNKKHIYYKQLALNQCNELRENQLADIFQLFPRGILHLNLSFNINLQNTFISRMPASISNLKTLNLQGIPSLDISTARGIVDRCTSLESIRFWEHITDDCLHVLSSLSKLNNIEFIQCDNVSDYGISVLLKSRKNLQILQFEKCNNITNRTLSTIRKSSFISSLLKLRIDNCTSITSEEKLNRLLKRAHRLNAFSFTGDYMYKPPLTDKSIEILTQSSNTQLKALNIYRCSNITDLSFQYISQRCSDIEEINIGHLSFSDSALASLAKSCKSIKRLELVSTCISNSTLLLFATNNPLLQQLSLQRCDNLTSGGIIVILPVLKNLTFLSLKENSVNEILLKEMEKPDILPSLRRLDIRRTSNRSHQYVIASLRAKKPHWTIFDKPNDRTDITNSMSTLMYPSDKINSVRLRKNSL